MSEEQKRAAGLIRTDKKVLENYFNYFYLISCSDNTKKL